jgi:hypothetical protein
MDDVPELEPSDVHLEPVDDDEPVSDAAVAVVEAEVVPVEPS